MLAILTFKSLANTSRLPVVPVSKPFLTALLLFTNSWKTLFFSSHSTSIVICDGKMSCVLLYIGYYSFGLLSILSAYGKSSKNFRRNSIPSSGKLGTN